ncbi:MAG TPA: histidinol phosphatase [Thermoanaerobacterales bacterium]|jgi:PHP family Zn ribbon phosphoesterase|nr:histidinol phosphatase [Thermoanaerobacterales bacterium]
MLAEYPADFHIHTCLSPCADDEMIPVNILNMAELMGTKILGICDHNSAGNVKAVLKVAQDYEILVLPGMEVQSVEEVHMLCFFESLYQILEWQEYVYRYLPPIQNDPRYFGHQWFIDSQGNIIGEENRMLMGSTSLTVEEISQKVSELKGLLIPAHVDRRHYSIIGQLGFIPETLKIDAVEFSKAISEADFRKTFCDMNKYTLITSSDAHCLQEMVYQKTFFRIESLNFKEVMMAFKDLEGRKVLIKD